MFQILFLLFALQIPPIIPLDPKNVNIFGNISILPNAIKHKSFVFASGPKNAKPIKWKPAYEKPEEMAKMTKKQKTFYFESDGTCGVWDSNANAYMKPKMNYSSLNGIQCLHEFHKIAFGPACGNPSFSRVKLCTMVHFLDNELPHESETLGGNEIDLALVLIDGCAVCGEGNGDGLEMGLSLGMTFEEGSFFTKCSKDTNVEVGGVEKLKFSLNNYGLRTLGKFKNENPGTSFIVPGILFQRFCKGMFGSDEMPNSFEKIWMKVTHNCGGEGRSFQVDLPPLTPREHQFHVAEIRGLLLDLENEDWVQFNVEKKEFGESKKSEWGNKLKGMGQK